MVLQGAQGTMHEPVHGTLGSQRHACTNPVMKRFITLYILSGFIPSDWIELLHFISHDRHNFYLFPRQELPFDGPSYEFLCQTTSIDFLSKYQFDFNACVREGR